MLMLSSFRSHAHAEPAQRFHPDTYLAGLLAGRVLIHAHTGITGESVLVVGAMVPNVAHATARVTAARASEVARNIQRASRHP